MKEETFKRRTEKNEVFFRAKNQHVQEGFDALDNFAKEDGVELHEFDPDTIMRFYCECADENCDQRISMSLREYNEIHKANDTFTIICGHDVASIEEIIFEGKEYCVVKKYEQPPKTADKLRKTPVDNT